MVEYKIFPAIGVARVGNAPEKFYVGPEDYRGLPENPDGSPFQQQDFRDAEGRLCRQAARFRVYRIDNGVAEEVTPGHAGISSIRWTVHLANKKSSWYTFAPAEGEHGYAPNHPLRNAAAEDRHLLLIDAGPRQIAGVNRAGVHFDLANVPPEYQGAHFPPKPLYPMHDSIDTLGELRTDAQGRLLVLGGYGVSGSADPDATINEYANNDGWWDDTSDGPVGATLFFDDGSHAEAMSSHVLVAPPKYAPELPNLVTLHDTIFDAMVRAGHYPEIYDGAFWRSGAQGYLPNFQSEIQPLIERATFYPWVAAIPSKPHKFDFAKLGALGPDGAGASEFHGLRQYIADVLRPPYEENTLIGKSGATMMPYLAGDNCLKPGTATSKYMRLTDTQYFFLQQWVAGHFVNHPPVEAGPQALTRGVLDNCVGGPFSPGIEMTWISREAAIYAEPFRIRNHFVPHGPLSLGYDPARGMEPGDVTRYMAVPWQADFNECAAQPLDGRTLWWWPAQRPEFVYLEPAPLKVAAFAAEAPPPPDLHSGRQVPWIGTDFDQMAPDFIVFPDDTDMVRYWSGLGFVMEKTVQGEQRFVEVERSLPRPFYPGKPDGQKRNDR
ncbi:LodA/GoxA family CTQ-dependent oxidase [Paraburkholderia bannensis]|uniref:LodA/GoxA family CTQ-dependent oxidase n=1 Tax=Paraburkholderia bannensis TaxID=765414 RepID=UPI002ABD1E63|nr:LodA/GoxA family CTQ-dependent oxidase [Paraburkholderia bannensis]